MKIAIVGSGISGLSAASSISQWADVVVYESEHRLGGHTHTQDVSLENIRFGVDTGFIVFNHRTYPGLKKWFEDLGVETAPSDMSFSASLNDGQIEWCGSDLNAVFAQRSNLLSPRFWAMLRDIVRFNREAPQDAHQIRLSQMQPAHGIEQDISASQTQNLSLGSYLDRKRYGKMFLDAYLLPMAGAIWSCPTETMREFPMETFTRFCENHGLLSINDRPQWYTVKGGSRQYIDRVKTQLAGRPNRVQWRIGHRVSHVRPLGGELSERPLKVQVSGEDRASTAGGSFQETFDAVILACHSDEAYEIIRSTSLLAKDLVRKVRYQENTAFLHTDMGLMPRRKRAWAAWNYRHDSSSEAGGRVSVSYWMNRLQPLPVRTPLFVTLNPTRMPTEEHVISQMRYAHPIFDGPASCAQKDLPIVQGQGSIWFAGAWTRYGFHEDGFQSGINAARLLKSRLTHEVTGTADEKAV